MSERKYLLGADCGTTAIKVALFDTAGNRIAARAQEYALIRPSAQRVEQEPEVYWTTFKACLARVLAESAVPRGGGGRRDQRALLGG